MTHPQMKLLCLIMLLCPGLSIEKKKRGTRFLIGSCAITTVKPWINCLDVSVPQRWKPSIRCTSVGQITTLISIRNLLSHSLWPICKHLFHSQLINHLSTRDLDSKRDINNIFLFHFQGDRPLPFFKILTLMWTTFLAARSHSSFFLFSSLLPVATDFYYRMYYLQYYGTNIPHPWRISFFVVCVCVCVCSTYAKL